jgi:hypothetical protein
MSLNSFRFGKHAQDELNEMFSTIMEKLQAPKEPPAPDPKILEIESRERIAIMEMNFKAEENKAKMERDFAEYQTRIQADQNKLQIEIAKLNQTIAKSQQEAADKQQELQVKIMEVQATAANDQSKIQSDAYYWEQENQIEAQRNEIALRHNENMAMLEASKAELKKQVDDTNQALETLRLQIEKQRDDKIQMEKLMEERRLERQDMLQHLQTLTKVQAETKAEVMFSAIQQQEKKAEPPVMPSINIQMPKRGKKVGKISTDGKGNPVVEIEEIEDELNKPAKASKQKGYDELSMDELNKKLQKAIENENYEEASTIKQERDNRNSN